MSPDYREVLVKLNVPLFSLPSRHRQNRNYRSTQRGACQPQSTTINIACFARERRLRRLRNGPYENCKFLAVRSQTS